MTRYRGFPDNLAPLAVPVLLGLYFFCGLLMAFDSDPETSNTGISAIVILLGMFGAFMGFGFLSYWQQRRIYHRNRRQRCSEQSDTNRAIDHPPNTTCPREFTSMQGILAAIASVFF